MDDSLLGVETLPVKPWSKRIEGSFSFTCDLSSTGMEASLTGTCGPVLHADWEEGTWLEAGAQACFGSRENPVPGYSKPADVPHCK